MLRWILCAALVMAALSPVGSAGLARAQPDMTEASSLYRSAEQAMADKRYDDAARDYGAAYEISKDAILFFKIASALDKGGKCPVAVTYYRRYLREGKPSADHQKLTTERIAACEASKPATAPTAPTAPAPTPTAPATGSTSDKPAAPATGDKPAPTAPTAPGSADKPKLGDKPVASAPTAPGSGDKPRAGDQPKTAPSGAPTAPTAAPTAPTAAPTAPTGPATSEEKKAPKSPTAPGSGGKPKPSGVGTSAGAASVAPLAAPAEDPAAPDPTVTVAAADSPAASALVSGEGPAASPEGQAQDQAQDQARTPTGEIAEPISALASIPAPAAPAAPAAIDPAATPGDELPAYPAPSLRRTAAWLSVGAGIAFVTVGAVLALSAEATEDDIADLYITRPGGEPLSFDRATQDRYDTLVDRGDRYQLMSWASFGAAAAVAGAATYLFLTSSATEQEARAQALALRPLLSREGAGVAASFGF
jgi:hypothetical protein